MSDAVNVRKRWSSGLEKKADPLRMAEPVHRKVPPGATTGQSIRRFQAKSPLLQVKEICLFYVRKCSGKYHDNKAAARYVHHMAEEIISQLSGVAGEIKRNKGEPELYQALLDEWNENFPPSLGAMGSPKAIAALVAQQSTEIADLREALQYEKARREKDVSEILRSMDAQLQAYKSSVMSERRHQQLLDLQHQTQQSSQLQALKEKQTSELNRVMEVHTAELNAQNVLSEQRLQDTKDTIQELCKQREDAEKRAAADRDRIIDAKNRKYQSLLQKYQELREQYNELVSNLHEEFSVLSTPSADDTTLFLVNEFGEDDIPDVLAAVEGEQGRLLSPAEIEAKRQKREQHRHDENARARDARRAKQRADLLGRIRQSEIGRNAQSALADMAASFHGAVPGGLGATVGGSLIESAEGAVGMSYQTRQLSKELEAVKKERGELQEHIQKLLDRIEQLTTDNKQYARRYKELERLHENMRRGVAVQLKGQNIYNASVTPDGALKPSVREIKAVSEVLCHTPHFLGPADAAGLVKAPQMHRISAYNHPGHF